MKAVSQSTCWMRLKKGIKVAALGVTLVTIAAASAQAEGRHDQGRYERQDGRHWGGEREWREHSGRAHHYWYGPRYVEQRRVVYAPPVIYAPPPVYREPGFTLFLPLNIR